MNATYVDPTHLTIQGDLRSTFAATYKIWIYQGTTYGWTLTTMSAVSFGSDATTITLADPVLRSDTVIQVVGMSRTYTKERNIKYNGIVVAAPSY